MNERQKHYSEIFSTFVKLSREKEFLLDRIESLLPECRESYLDVGPGDGVLMSSVARFFGRTVAIESNHAFIPRLEGLADEVVSGRIEEVEARGQFDMILGSHMLGYVAPSDRCQIVRRLFGHLKPKGILILIYNSVNSDVYRILLALSAYSGKCWAKPVVFRKPGDILGAASGYITLKRDRMPILTNEEKAATDVAEFIAFGDRPLNEEGRRVLQKLVDGYRREDGWWQIMIEHEFLCLSPSRNVLKSCPFLAKQVDFTNC